MGGSDAADDPIVVAVGNDAQFVSLCKVLGRSDLCSDPRFTAYSDRVENKEMLVPLIGAEIAEQSSEYWRKLFEESGIPTGPGLSIVGGGRFESISE